MSEEESSSNPVIILDTNILQYFAGKHSGKAFSQHLYNLMKEQGYELSISDISISELLSRAKKSQEKEIFNTLRVIKGHKVT